MAPTFKITVDGVEIGGFEAGAKDSARSFLFLHGWPQDSSEFAQLVALAGEEARAVAIDLPGVGASTTALPSGVKSAIAPYVLRVIEALELKNVTLVGHDAGGMVAYACLRRFPAQLRAVAILNTVIPGLEPWEEVLRIPQLFHFALHAVPRLPELLVQGKQAAYFDFFFQYLAKRPEAITAQARERYAAAYASASALKTGFDWYRGFTQDAEENRAATADIDVPVLYVRGAQERVDLDTYLRGFRAVGIKDLSSALIEDSGHFSPEEQPGELWRRLRSLTS